MVANNRKRKKRVGDLGASPTDLAQAGNIISEYNKEPELFEEPSTLPEPAVQAEQDPVGTQELDTEITPIDTTPLDQTEIQSEVTPVDVPEVNVETPTGTTGIAEVDTELDKLRKEKEKKISDEYDSYNMLRVSLKVKKDYYTNFDETNTTFEGVLGDLRNAQMDTEGELSPDQLQQIATKYGISVEEVQNPTSIFNKLRFTDEGKQKFGVTSAEDQINKLTTDYGRRKEDLTFQLEGTKENVRNQMDDVATQLGRNLSFAEAQGVWTGTVRSSGYAQGLENMKQDSETTISRLQGALDRTNEAYDTNIQRLTDDYETSTTQAKNELEDQLRTLRFDSGLQLSGLEEKYGLGSTELTKALDAINEEFGTKSQEVFNKYLQNMKSIQSITNTNIDQQERIMNILDEKQNRRYDELIANNGVLLSNTSLNTLFQSYQNGELSSQRFGDLKNLMTNSVVQTLSQYGVVNTADLNTITTLLSQGQTPAQIVASMQGQTKFQPREEITEVSGIDTVFDPTTGRYKPVDVVTTAEVDLTDFIKGEEGFREQAYDDATGLPLQPGETPKGVATVGYGFTSINGVPVKAGDTITQQEAEAEIQRQIQRHSNYEALVEVPLSNSQKTALSSFEYNLGPNIWKADGKDIIDMINNGDLQGAADLMLKFNKARDPETDELRVLKGLENRRAKEANLLLQSTSEVSGYDDALAPLYNKFNEGKFTSADYKNLTVPQDEFVQQASNYKVELSKQGQGQIRKLLGLIDNLRENPGRTAAALGGGRVPFTSAADYQADFDAFVSNTALDNLIKTKAQGATFGALSNQELNFIKDSATSLKLGMSEDAFNEELYRMEELLRKGLDEGTEGEITVDEPTQQGAGTALQNRANSLVDELY